MCERELFFNISYFQFRLPLKMTKGSAHNWTKSYYQMRLLGFGCVSEALDTISPRTSKRLAVVLNVTCASSEQKITLSVSARTDPVGQLAHSGKQPLFGMIQMGMSAGRYGAPRFQSYCWKTSSFICWLYLQPLP